MDLHAIFKKWKLNQNLFASFLNIPKGSFNNKINPKYPGILRKSEDEILRLKFKEMINDLQTYVNRYPEVEEDFTGDIDEKITYNGKTFDN